MKTRSINAIKFNTFQRTLRNTLILPRWDENGFCHSYVINMALQQVTNYENNNKYGKNQKFSRKLRDDSVGAI